MTTPPLPSPSSLRPSIHARRCIRHTTREAAARCPGCNGFFCRECVVDHAGRVLCADCIARAVVEKPVAWRRWTAGRRTASLLAAGCVTWLAFYGLGVALLRIPPTFHDGTIWQKLDDPGP